jgi:hypothetical protein
MKSINHPINIKSRSTAIGLFLVLACFATVYGNDLQAVAQSSDKPQAKQSIQKLDDDAMRTLVGLNGKRTGPLMVYLWYTACQPCDDKLVDIDKIYLEFKNKGLDVALVAIEPMDDTKGLVKYLYDHKIVTPTYLLNSFEDDLSNDVFLKDWEAIVPSVFFYDRNGHIIFSETDETHIDYRQLKPRLLEALTKIK